MQFCPYCGVKLTARTNFCPHCGNKLLLSGMLNPSSKNENQDFIKNAAKPVTNILKNVFRTERKKQKLYKQWIEFSNLPPEEIPLMDKNPTGKKSKEEEEEKEEDIPENDYHFYVP
jgi:hypothetical protein